MSDYTDDSSVVPQPPRTMLALYASELRDHAGLVSGAVGMNADQLAQYKQGVYQAADALDAASKVIESVVPSVSFVVAQNDQPTLMSTMFWYGVCPFSVTFLFWSAVWYALTVIP